MKITKIFNLYDEYNEKYFGGTLPYCDIIVGKLSDAFGWTIYDKGFCPVIVLDENLNTRYTKITLLHEMIHVWQGIKGYNLDHDETFQGVARNICKSEKFNYKKF